MKVGSQIWLKTLSEPTRLMPRCHSSKFHIAESSNNHPWRHKTFGQLLPPLAEGRLVIEEIYGGNTSSQSDSACSISKNFEESTSMSTLNYMLLLGCIQQPIQIVPEYGHIGTKWTEIGFNMLKETVTNWEGVGFFWLLSQTIIQSDGPFRRRTSICTFGLTSANSC